MSIAAIIDTKDFPSRGAIRTSIESVINSVDRFQQVIIISPYYREGAVFYDDWREHHQYLDEHTQLQIKARFEENLVTTKYVLHIHPLLDISTEGIDLLKASASSANPHQTNFSLKSIVDMTDSGFSFFNGYILVVALFDFLWNIFELGKYSKVTDARLDAVIQNGSFRWIAKKTFFDRFRNYRQKRAIFEEGTAIIRPQGTSKDFGYHLLRTHFNLGIGLWIPIYIGMFFSVLLPALVAIFSINDGTALTSWFFIFTSIVWGSQMASAYFLTNMTYKMNYLPVYAALFPFYIMTFFVVVIATRVCR